MDYLEEIFSQQMDLNKRLFLEKRGMDFEKLCSFEFGITDQEKIKIDWMLKFSRALIHESIELEGSLPWKWWKEMSADWQNVHMELIDQLHFWVSMCQIAGLDPEKIFTLYTKKNKLNHVRQDGGYGGDYKKVDENGVEDNKRIDELIGGKDAL